MREAWKSAKRSMRLGRRPYDVAWGKSGRFYLACEIYVSPMPRFEDDRRYWRITCGAVNKGFDWLNVVRACCLMRAERQATGLNVALRLP